MTQTHCRLAAATAAAVALVLAAPYVGVVRSQIRSAFPGQFLLIINLLFDVGFEPSIPFRAGWRPGSSSWQGRRVGLEHRPRTARSGSSNPVPGGEGRTR